MESKECCCQVVFDLTCFSPDDVHSSRMLLGLCGLCLRLLWGSAGLRWPTDCSPYVRWSTSGCGASPTLFASSPTWATWSWVAWRRRGSPWTNWRRWGKMRLVKKNKIKNLFHCGDGDKLFRKTSFCFCAAGNSSTGWSKINIFTIKICIFCETAVWILVLKDTSLSYDAPNELNILVHKGIRKYSKIHSLKIYTEL